MVLAKCGPWTHSVASPENLLGIQAMLRLAEVGDPLHPITSMRLVSAATSDELSPPLALHSMLTMAGLVGHPL